MRGPGHGDVVQLQPAEETGTLQQRRPFFLFLKPPDPGSEQQRLQLIEVVRVKEGIEHQRRGVVSPLTEWIEPSRM